jgi:hypothetical protein
MEKAHTEVEHGGSGEGTLEGEVGLSLGGEDLLGRGLGGLD